MLQQYQSILFLLFISSVFCYDGCKYDVGKRGCSHRVHEGVLVTCNGHASESLIPENIPSDTVLISLVNFDFGHLQRANFSRFKILECLNIIDSRVSKIDDDTFSDTVVLHELNLRGTNLKSNSLGFLTHESFTARQLSLTHSKNVKHLTIPPHAGRSLETIRSLRLNNNSISHIDASVLRHLDSVETLSFSSNQLSSLNWHLLRRISGLNELYLDGNLLQTIPGDEAASIFYTVNQLTLGDNPLHCNCKLIWLKEYYETMAGKKLDENHVYCKTPTRSLLRDIDIRTMTCKQPSMPTLDWKDLGDGKAAVNCSAVGDPAPTITMLFPDGQKMITPPGNDLSQLTTSTHYVMTTAGPLTCISSNTEGAREITEQSPGWVGHGNIQQCSLALICASMVAYFLTNRSS